MRSQVIITLLACASLSVARSILLPRNACAPGQNLECCNGDPTDPQQMGTCDLTENSCDPNSIFPSAYCCDQKDGFTQFDTCKPVGNNGASK